MPTLSTLALFSIAVLGLLLSPGPNMALVVSQSLSAGRRAGLAVAAGIFAADLLMTVLVCAGVAAAVAAWPLLFDVVRWAGAAYLLWLGVQALRARHAAASAPAALGAVARSATLVSLLNPKALLFFLVLLPQFVDAGRGGIAGQLLVLGLTLSLIALLFHAVLAVCSGQAARLAGAQAGAASGLQRLHAGVLLALALRLLLLERPLRL